MEGVKNRPRPTGLDTVLVRVTGVVQKFRTDGGTRSIGGGPVDDFGGQGRESISCPALYLSVMGPLLTGRGRSSTLHEGCQVPLRLSWVSLYPETRVTPPTFHVRLLWFTTVPVPCLR